MAYARLVGLVAAPWSRRGVLLVAGACMLAGVLGGLGRLGFVVPFAGRAPEHGPLLVLGVFGTIIALERAVALARPWGYGAPAAGALGALAIAARLVPAPWIAVAACVWLALVNAAIVRRQAAAFTWLMLLGSLVLAAGALGWALGAPVFQVAPSWLGFFVLTIVAERLELSRLAPTPRWAPRLLVALCAATAAAVVAACAPLPAATRAAGVLLAAIAAWQLRFDIARRTVRQRGLPRFAALGVLFGTVWLAIAGVLLASRGLPPAGPGYDAVLHSVLVGFVLALVFAHAPIILPAVARSAIPFHPALYLGPAVLHAGLVARLAGDLGDLHDLRRAGAALNALSLAVFVATAAWSAAAAYRARRRRAMVPPS